MADQRQQQFRFETSVQHVMVAGEVTPVWVWVDGQRTNEQRTTKDGLKLWTVQVLMETRNFGKAALLPLRVQFGSAETPELGLGTFVDMDNAYVLAARLYADGVHLSDGTSDSLVDAAFADVADEEAGARHNG